MTRVDRGAGAGSNPAASLPEDASRNVGESVPGYACHPFHDPARQWPETNCYVDVWIELLHWAGLNVAPAFAFTLAADYEGDQWSFYKPPHSDLERLYGIDVVELTLWKDLEAHSVEQTGRGNVVLVEADSFYLPDLAGRDYQRTHTKTTIGITSIDPSSETLRYFHNRSQYDVGPPDYRALLRLDVEPETENLPPFCEVAKLGRRTSRSEQDLREIALSQMREHFARRPAENPVRVHARALTAELEALIDGGGVLYDLYAFAGIRQCGSCFGFTGDFLRFIGESDPGWATAADAFEGISSRASMLVLKMARVVHGARRAKVAELQATFEEMAEEWDRGMAFIGERISG